MRAILAALFIFVCISITLTVIDLYGENDWPWWAGPTIIAVMICSTILAMYLFNRRGQRPNFPRKSLDETIKDLEAHGLLEKQTFSARRAFAVEEYDDEGSQYFIELVDGRVLFLIGQYLYDFEPLVEDEDDEARDRAFPCTAFEVLRHRTGGYVIDIRCQGIVLEPEFILPPIAWESWQLEMPEDGEIFTSLSYDEIKRKLVLPQ